MERRMPVTETPNPGHDPSAKQEPVVILGAGMAGLAAAYALCHDAHRNMLVLEQDDHIGGASRTVEFKGFRFDLGGHRFYTKKRQVQEFVTNLLGEDLLTVSRISRIHFNGRFVNYPLQPLNALLSLGAFGSSRALADYLWAKLRRLLKGPGREENFQQWAVDRFGRYLYEVYFRVYTEKLWGLRCEEISADFAEQRIKNLSFREAVKEAVLGKSNSTSLVREFLYPRYGFGQIARSMADGLAGSGEVLTGHKVEELHHDDAVVRAVFARDGSGARREFSCSSVISSIPVSDAVRAMVPPAPERVQRAAASLAYRDLVILFLVVNRPQVSPDHWIYAPSREIGFARLHEPKNWSAGMAPLDRTGLVLEYFCQEGDARWRQPAEEIAAEAARNLEKLGLIERHEVVDFTTVHLPKAYPVYKVGYRQGLDPVLDYLGSFRNMQSIGRNGCFVYTGSDHYIDMGLKAAENLLGGNHELSHIGRDQEYAEQTGPTDG